MKSLIGKMVMVVVLTIASFAASAAEGNFVSHGSYTAEGVAKVFTDASGSMILKLKNFTTDTGPAVRIYLSKGKWPQNFVDLGDILAFSGSQEYLIPEGTNLEELNHVLIWCSKFNSLFGYAKLKNSK